MLARLIAYTTHSVISAADNMADVRRTRSTMPAFVVVLFPYLRLCVVVEVGRT